MILFIIITIIILILCLSSYRIKESYISEKDEAFLYLRHHSNNGNLKDMNIKSDFCSSKHIIKNVEDLAHIWKKSGASLKDCSPAIIIGSDNIKNIGIGGIWKQGFYNISPKKYGYCFDKGTNIENPCCSAKNVVNALNKPSNKFGVAYTCYNAPKKIPKGFIGENNNNFIGKFCHVGGENFYKEIQSDIELGGKFQWGGGQCSEGCNYNNNSICKNNTCNDKYPFPYYYYDKFLKSLGITEKNKKKMESKALKISQDICKGVYN